MIDCHEKPIEIYAELANEEVVVVEDECSTVEIYAETSVVFTNAYSPYVDERTGTWWQYDDKNKTFVDTGIVADLRGEGVKDYNNLLNIPTLDGRKIIGDMYEEDPTVPSWAKELTKPKYTAKEINALDENSAISIAELASLFE